MRSDCLFACEGPMSKAYVAIFYVNMPRSCKNSTFNRSKKRDETNSLERLTRLGDPAPNSRHLLRGAFCFWGIWVKVDVDAHTDRAVPPSEEMRGKGTPFITRSSRRK